MIYIERVNERLKKQVMVNGPGSDLPIKDHPSPDPTHTIRNAPATDIRRKRVKVNGVVMPSPVGVAMEKLG